LNPESQGDRPLKRGTSRDSDQANRSADEQNNQKTLTKAEGKPQKKPNPETRHSFQRRFRGQKTAPGTAMWVAQQLAEEKEEQRIGILSTWVHNQQWAEVTQETIEEINNLSDKDAIEALNELRMPRRYIRKQGQSQMNIAVLLQALSDGNTFRLKALLDSGCTGYIFAQ